jgi:predicted permease
VSKVDLRDTLNDSGTTTVARPARRWIAALLAAEFAVTFVLIAVAVMSVRNNLETRRTEFQIDPASLLTMWLTLPNDLYSPPGAKSAFFERLDETIGTSLGPIAFANVLPYGGGDQRPLTMPGRSLGENPPTVSVVSASERYFDVLGVPLVRGRAFSSTDGRPGAEAAIVNQRFVQMFLSGQEPIGARIRVGGAADAPWLEIVGVATTVRQQIFGPEPDPAVFLPFRPSPQPTTVILVRTTDTAGVVGRLREEVARLDANLPLYRVMPFEQAVRNAVWNGRLSDAIIRSIAIIAFVLALIGLYAVTGHTVERWTRELGLRIALGAKSGQIVWLVLRRVLSQLSVGLALGLIGALAFDRMFNDPVNQAATGVRMMDAGALAFIVVAITAVAVLACLVPIRRAARVNPIDALRAS